jgi:hypothetical protein
MECSVCNHARPRATTEPNGICYLLGLRRRKGAYNAMNIAAVAVANPMANPVALTMYGWMVYMHGERAGQC